MQSSINPRQNLLTQCLREPISESCRNSLPNEKQHREKGFKKEKKKRRGGGEEGDLILGSKFMCFLFVLAKAPVKRRFLRWIGHEEKKKKEWDHLKYKNAFILA